MAAVYNWGHSNVIQVLFSFCDFKNLRKNVITFAISIYSYYTPQATRIYVKANKSLPV